MIHTLISKEIAQFLSFFRWNHDETLISFATFQVNINNFINYIIDIIFHFSFNLNQPKKKQKNPSKTGRLISWSVNHNPVASCFRVLRPRCISDRPLWLVQIGGHRTVDVMDMEWHGDLWDPYIFSGRKHKWMTWGCNYNLTFRDSNSICKVHRGPPYLGSWRKFRWSCCGWDDYNIKITQFGSKFWVIKIRNGNVPPEPCGLRWGPILNILLGLVLGIPEMIGQKAWEVLLRWFTVHPLRYSGALHKIEMVGHRRNDQLGQKNSSTEV